MCCNLCCKKHSFSRSFFHQLFDIGDSAGSLLNEGINVFRTFQRVSAPKQFSTMFSYECASLFKWVTDLIQLLFSFFESKPFTNFDYYTLYSLVFPIAILYFITVKLKKFMVITYTIGYGICLGFGVLFGLIGANGKTYIFSFLPVIAFIIFICGNLTLQKFFTTCCKAKVGQTGVEDEDDDDIGHTKLKFHFSFSLLATSIIFCLLMIPVTEERFIACLIMIIFIPILLAIVFFVEFFNCACCHNSLNNSNKYEAKMILLLNNILTLLIVPSTEKLVSIITVNYYYRKQWCCYFTYFVINLLIPIMMSVILVRGEHPTSVEKYRYSKSNYLYYINVVDILRQIVYAFFSSFNFIWGCFSVEVLWLLLIIFLHPYYKISDYSFTIFTSLLIIAGNLITILSTFMTIGPFSLTETIIIFIMVCMPAVISMYSYFTFDFKTDDIKTDIEMDDLDEPSENIKEYDIAEKMGIILKSFTSFAFFLYGSNIHLFSYELKE